MQITINIPDNRVTEVVEAFSDRYGREPGEDDQGFIKSVLIRYLRDAAKTRAVRLAEQEARGRPDIPID